MLLRMRDVLPQLQDKWLQLYWPDDSRWWPAQVIHVNHRRHRALLLYETGLLLLAFKLTWCCQLPQLPTCCPLLSSNT